MTPNCTELHYRVLDRAIAIALITSKEPDYERFLFRIYESNEDVLTDMGVVGMGPGMDLVDARIALALEKIARHPDLVS